MKIGELIYYIYEEDVIMWLLTKILSEWDNIHLN